MYMPQGSGSMSKPSPDSVRCVQPQVHVHSATTSTVMMRVHGLAHTFTLQGGTVHVPATHASMLSAT
jgi:hypothetical protein